jgi:hypothetical protein
MANSVLDVFGPTPEELEYQKGQEQEELARQDYRDRLATAGEGLGMFAGLARSGVRQGEQLRKARLFGESPSPQMEKATVMKQVMDKYQGQDMSNPEVLAKMSGELGNLGFPREAMQLMDQAKSKTIGMQEAGRKAILDDIDLQTKKANLLKLQNEAAGGDGDKMTGKMLDDFLGEAKVAKSYANLSSTFDPDYTGYTFDAIGDLKKLQAKAMPMSEFDRDLTAWWMKYQEQVNAVRNDLFGSALTETEKNEFLKAMVTPGMDSEIAKRNLETQAKILKNAYNEKVELHKKQGWKVSGLVGQAGVEESPTTTSGEWSVEVMEE